MRTISRKIFFIISQLLVGSIAQIVREECCPKIVLEGTPFAGVYNLEDQVFRQYPVYKQDPSIGNKFMVNCPNNNRWVISDGDFGSWQSFFVCWYYTYVQYSGTYCPADTTGPWRQSNGAVIPGSKVRCSNCAGFPNEPECATCCNKVFLASTNREWRATPFYMVNFGGGWTDTGNTINGKSEYRSDNNNNFCLWFNNNDRWMINDCGTGGTRGYIFAFDGPAGMKCPEQATDWRFHSQNGNGMITDRTMKTTCNDGGGTPAPATCCSRVFLASTNREWQATPFLRRFGGRWTATGNTISGKSEYMSDNNNNYCLWFNNNIAQWMINRCGSGGRLGYIFGRVGTGGMMCPEHITEWRFWSQNGNGHWVNDNFMAATCD